MTITSVSYAVMASFEPAGGAWVEVLNGPVCLRCWRAEPQQGANDIEPKSFINRVYIVLPEVFGVNAWVRSVADRLAAHGYPALAVPLFARTAPNLELAYETSDLAQGRRHKDATTSDQILADVDATITLSESITNPLDIAIVDDYDTVMEFYDSLAKVTTALKRDLALVLNMEIPSEAAGDND